METSNPKPADSLAELFVDLRSYAKAEAEVNQEQWAFAQRCTSHARHKFTALQAQASDSLKAVDENRQLIASLPSNFGAQLDELESHISKMEQVVRGLDEYSIALERRYLQ